jgi:O-antigen/teichoic acid export membrane protein
MINFIRAYKFSSFGKVLIRFASSQIISHFLRIVSGFLVVRMLDPEMYGTFTGVGIYMGYFALGDIGVINGLGREFPYQLGKGNNEYGRQLANTTMVVTSIVGILTAIFFLVFSVYHFATNNSILGFTFLSYVIIAGLNLYNSRFLPALYRTSSDFQKLARQNITVGIWNLLSVVLVWKWGFGGLLIRGVALALIQYYLLFKNKPYPLKFSFTWKDMVQLFKTGLPIYMVGQVNPLWSTIVHNIIFAMGGAKYFGLYALANIVQKSMAVVPQSFGQVIYPRMSIMFGQGKSPREIIRLNLKPLFFQFFVILGLAISGAIVLPYIIPYLLPKYIEGIGPAQWMMFVPVVISFGAINNIFNVTGQQKYYFIALVLGALIGTGYIYFRSSTGGFDLMVFPQGMIIGKVFQQALSLFFALRIR